MIHIDIDSLTALRYFYNGETLGISKEEISRNEKQRKLLLPAVLKEFLLKYGSLGVNFGEGNVLPPDLMRIVDDKVIFAYMDDQAMLAFRRADFAEDNPQLFYVKPDFNEKETKISWRFIKASDFFMHNFLIGLVMCNLPRIDVQWEDPSQLEQSEVPEEVLNLLLTGQSDNLVFFTKKYRVFLC